MKYYHKFVSLSQWLTLQGIGEFMFLNLNTTCCCCKFYLHIKYSRINTGDTSYCDYVSVAFIRVNSFNIYSKSAEFLVAPPCGKSDFYRDGTGIPFGK